MDVAQEVKPEVTEAEPTQGQDATPIAKHRGLSFPYYDLGNASEVAVGVHEVSGAALCKTEQLAAQLRVSMSSSGFRLRLATARMFGLIKTSRSTEGLILTPLGLRIVDDRRSREARVTAFLNIPLYKMVYDRYKGQKLPPAAALQRDMASMGVVETQVDRARQSFDRSARYTGFFEMSADRLVLPAGASEQPAETSDRDHSAEGSGEGGGKRGGDGGGSGDASDNVSPSFAKELLAKFPTFDPSWSDELKGQWFKGFAQFMELTKRGGKQ